jgi:hypothetical protein
MATLFNAPYNPTQDVPAHELYGFDPTPTPEEEWGEDGLQPNCEDWDCECMACLDSERYDDHTCNHGEDN